MHKKIPPSELILNDDGSIYHLGLRPEHIGSTIITVGDPERVERVSRHLDQVDHIIRRREFVTHVGTLRNRTVTIISTGIGTDNIDIVLNELDALVNIDLEQRKVKKKHTALDIIRIGTSGTIRSDVEIDSYIRSRYSIGLDVLGQYYPAIGKADCVLLSQQVAALGLDVPHYIAPSGLTHDLDLPIREGITITAPGFYAPQSRSLRLPLRHADILGNFKEIEFQNIPVTNLEMETAGIYMLSHLLGHRAVSYNAILANRSLGTFSKSPQTTVDRLIKSVMDVI